MTNSEQQSPSLESFLIADCGSVNTSLSLFDVAAGSYRLIARTSVPTTLAEPTADISVGVQQAMRQLSETTGRQLLSERGTLMRPTRPTGNGVDHFAAVVSAAAPLETILVGLNDDVSLYSARKVLGASYVNEVDAISPIDERRELHQVSAIVDTRPDLLFLVGGTDGGAEHRLQRLIETVGLGIGMLSKVKRPQVVFAGNMSMREQVRHAVGDHASLQIANNVRPDLQTEQLDHAALIVADLYEELKIGIMPGIQKLREWSTYPIVPTARAYRTVIGYFAALQKSNVLGLDIGSSSTTLIMAKPEGSTLKVRTDLGMGRPAASLLDRLDRSAIAAWTPYEVGDEEIAAHILNKELYPQTVAMTGAELQLEQSIAREIIRKIVTDASRDWGWESPRAPQVNMVIARGGIFGHSVRPGHALLMLLDALQPAGLFSIGLDTDGVLPALGTLAAHDPLAVVQALAGGLLSSLGWVIAPTGKARAGQTALTVIMESQRVGRIEVEVAYGTIEVLPLAQGESAELTLKPTRRFDIGSGPGQGKKVSLQGGLVGIVVDARGRPLNVPAAAAARNEQLRQWLWDVGG